MKKKYDLLSGIPPPPPGIYSLHALLPFMWILYKGHHGCLLKKILCICIDLLFVTSNILIRAIPAITDPRVRLTDDA